MGNDTFVGVSSEKEPEHQKASAEAETAGPSPSSPAIVERITIKGPIEIDRTRTGPGTAESEGTKASDRQAKIIETQKEEEKKKAAPKKKAAETNPSAKGANHTKA